jgi:hypothetical protein
MAAMTPLREGLFCEKHQEWSPTGDCRWCEPAAPWTPLVCMMKASLATAIIGDWCGAPAVWRWKPLIPRMGTYAFCDECHRKCENNHLFRKTRIEGT